MRSEFLLKLLNRIGPVDRFGRLVVISDVLIKRSLQSISTGKVIGLQMFTLQQTEPDFNLIEPGSIGRQPMHLEVQVRGTLAFLFAEPVFQLLRGMRGSIIKNEDHRMHLTAQRFGNDVLLHKGLEIDEALALSARSVDLAIGDGESCKQMSGSTTMIACFMQQRLAWTSGARRVFALPCLNGGFLIETDQPGAFVQECLCLAIGVQDRTGSLQEGDGIMDMLPGMIAPGAKAFGFEPAADRTCREAREGRILDDVSSQFGPTPARERYLFLLGQATGDGRDLHAHLRGKNASVLHCGARQQAGGF